MALSLKDIRDTSFVQQHDGLSQGSNELAASSNGKGCDRSQKDDTRRKKKSVSYILYSYIRCSTLTLL